MKQKTLFGFWTIYDTPSSGDGLPARRRQMARQRPSHPCITALLLPNIAESCIQKSTFGRRGQSPDLLMMADEADETTDMTVT